MSLFETFPSISATRLPLHDRPECIIASNRGPIEYYVDTDDTYKTRLGPGGLVTALLGAIQHRRVAWFALAMSKIDRLGAQVNQDISSALPPAFADLTLHLLSIPQETYDKYYSHICNGVLWPVQHFLLNPATGTTFTQQTRDAWEQGYRATNEAIAYAIIRELQEYGTDVPVLIQDYQLYLVAELIRSLCPNARLSHVTHIPWPEVRYMALLPHYMIQAIYRSMAMNDVLGFQTAHDARNFLIGATSFLEGAEIVWNSGDRPGTLHWQGRSTQVCLYPAMLNAQHLYAEAQSDKAQAAGREVRSPIQMSDAGQLILRIDRMEPAKNIINGFRAYDRMLKTHPELYKRVTFLALFIPSREILVEYRSYECQVRELIADINTRHELQGWQPIVAAFGNNRARALACLQDYDVLFVNPVIDGLNLVVKEGGLLNKRSGVIILSQTAGAHTTLRDHVLTIAPLDIDTTAEVLFQALKMPTAERMCRANMIREILLQEDAVALFETQIKTLSGI